MIVPRLQRSVLARRLLLATAWLCATVALAAAVGLDLNVCGMMVLWGDCSTVEKGVSVAVIEGVFSIAFNDINLMCMSSNPSSWVPSVMRSGSSDVEWFRLFFWSRGIDAPLWAIALTLAMITMVLTRIARRSGRPGTCPSCAYNLSGLPPQSPCPECGHPRTPSN